MKSPTEAIFTSAEASLATANEELETKKQNAESYAKGRAVADPIDQALKVLTEGERRFKRPSVEIKGYGQAEDESLDVTVAYEAVKGSAHSQAEHLLIRGTLNRNGAGKSKPFDMYRVARVSPATDGGYLHPQYEIDVACDGDFTPLAVVVQNSAGRQSSRFAFNYLATDWQKKLDPKTPSLEEKGLFIDPHAEALIGEVHTILGMATAQVQAAPAPQVIQAA